MATSGRNAEDFSPSMLLGSDIELDHHCVPCDRQGARFVAYGYCVDCSEHLCEACYQVHTKPTPCRNHVLLDKARMPKWQSFLGCTGDVPTLCSKHKEKTIEYNCRDHDKLACNVCVTMGHRNCKLDYIPEVSKDYKTNREYRSFKESLTALQANIDEAKLANSCRQQEIEDNRTKLKQDINQYRKGLDEILEKWEKDTLNEADVIFDGFLATYKTVEEQFDKLLEDLHRLHDMFKAIDEQEQLLYVCVKKYTRQISQQQKKFAELDTDYFHHMLFVFEPDTQLQSPIHQDSKFGKITKRGRAVEILALRREIRITDRQKLFEPRELLKFFNLQQNLRRLEEAESLSQSFK